MAFWVRKAGLLTSCSHPSTSPYPHRLEKVKFGVPLHEVCKNNIPGPLLVLILKLNKEAPQRKDVFRAPGNTQAMKKLILYLQSGRLVNVENYSVYTIASVLKKFLRKIPGGIFGRDGEAELFEIVDIDDEYVQQERMHRLLMTLPEYTQRLLVLLFGTFRTIASNSERANTGMTSEAIGVSVAPSFFQSCVSDGKTARMEDVLRFKVATKIMKHMIDKFAEFDLFGRDNYEYYARVTGRILRVQDEWICSFRYPPPPSEKTAQQNYALRLALETEKTWLQCECERLGGKVQEESYSTPALLTSGSSVIGNSAASLALIPEHTLLESCARLSVSLEGTGGLYNPSGKGSSSTCSTTSTTSSAQTTSRSSSNHHMTHEELEQLRAVNRYAESTKSLSYLPQVHERQTARMRTRSEWFLNTHHSLTTPPINSSTPLPGACGGGGSGSIAANIGGTGGLSASAESVHYKRPSRRSKHLNRSSSRRNKENGSRKGSFRNNKNATNVVTTNDDQREINQLAKRNTRVSFEASSSGGTPTCTQKTAYNYDYHHHHQHSKSIDQVVISERRNSQQHEFNNRLSMDNDLLVSTVWAITSSPNEDAMDVGLTGMTTTTTTSATAQSSTATTTTTTTHSKPPRI